MLAKQSHTKKPLFNTINNSALLLCLVLTLTAAAQDYEHAEKRLTELGEEQLLLFFEPEEIFVTSSARRPQPIARATSAMYVITAEDIRQFGAGFLADLLRTVPGLEVSHIRGFGFTLGIRGFATTSNPRIQILLDGRSLHEPYWGAEHPVLQPIFLENIERIEIVRGAAGVTWGANAMNGVINIITKKAADTQGGFVYGAFGNRGWQDGYLRLGGKDDKIAWRGTVGAFHYNGFGNRHGRETTSYGGSEIKDYVQKFQTTGRADIKLSDDTEMTLTGGHIFSTVGAWNSHGIRRPSQFMVLFWKKTLSDESTIEVAWTESFFEERFYNYSMRARKDMIELKHHFTSNNHNIVWGADYTRDSFHEIEMKEGWVDAAEPDNFANDELNFFIQDEIALADNLWLTIGNRQSYNELSHHGWAGMVGLVWEVAPKHYIRGAISKSFRKPVLYESFTYDTQYAGWPKKIGNQDLFNERLISYELGYKGQLAKNLHLTIDGFINKHKDLIGEKTDKTFYNTVDITTYGLETAVDWRPRDWWFVKAGHTYEHQTDENTINSKTTGKLAVFTPAKHKIFLINRFSLDKSTTLNTMLFWSDTYYNKNAPPATGAWAHKIEPYWRFDVRLARKLWDDKAELAIGVMNLTEQEHYEGSTEMTEVPRMAYVQFFYNF